MAKEYRWRATTDYRSATSLSYGVTPTGAESWQTAEAGQSNSGTWTYWYRDANVEYGGQYVDAHSSRVALSVTQSWETTIDARNNLTVSITTTINSIVRDDCRGYNQDTPGRSIILFETNGGTPVLNITDNQVATPHTIYQGPLSLQTLTFTLAPGENLQRSSLYLHNQTVGAVSYDDIWIGVQFMNPLPRETVPHAVLGGNVWLSHNRIGGDLRVYNGGRWSGNLANTDGGAGYGDPPSIFKDNKWVNVRTFGRET